MEIYWVISDVRVPVGMLQELRQTEKASIEYFHLASFDLKKIGILSCDAALFLLDKSHERAIAAIKAIKNLAPMLPIVATVKKGDIAAAVAIMRTNICDVIEMVGNWQGTVKECIKVANKRILNCQPPLTSVEKDIMQFVCRGYTNTEIAEILHRHERTIEEHRSTLYRKFDVRNNLHLIRKAFETGLLKELYCPINPSIANGVTSYWPKAQSYLTEVSSTD